MRFLSSSILCSFSSSWKARAQPQLQCLPRAHLFGPTFATTTFESTSVHRPAPSQSAFRKDDHSLYNLHTLTTEPTTLPHRCGRTNTSSIALGHVLIA